MRCPSCDSQNPEDAKFCDVCGTSLPRRCPACGASNRTTAKFCNGCGAALGQETQLGVTLSRETEGSKPANLAFTLGIAVEPQFVPEGERKMVTAGAGHIPIIIQRLSLEQDSCDDLVV